MHAVPSPTPPFDRKSSPDPWGRLRFDRRVPRETVHKSALAEVLLSDAARLGSERFAVGAAWHRDHFLGHLGGPAADSVLLAETVRQAAIHLSHRFLEIPLHRPFVLSELAVDLDEALPPVDATPLALGLDVHARRTAGNPRRSRFELDAVVRAGHGPVGRARMRWEAVEPRLYTTLRKRGAPGPDTTPPRQHARAVPLLPSRVGQRHGRDVLLAADEARSGRWWLRLDLGHPVLFDHESDHIPGMALLEAFRQALVVTTAQEYGTRAPDAARCVRSLASAFTSFGELDQPVSITAERAADDGRDEGVALVLRAAQGDRELAYARAACAAPCRHRAGAAC
ncbi:ScbA/BarX family gamma-butyrolactone biosynthesis protein [Streptomyces sp. NPDC051172]|uniref:ScbA/BarX family gamma-butyrolactone biosynthesis protein n=1 Tax=Streptomyces sp. NPDC051172 TaxID=3155796 RepID=UPI0034384512